MAIKQRSVQDQPKDRMFAMKLNFSMDLCFPELNELLGNCGFHEKPVLENAKAANIEQVIAFIPDAETIQKYCSVIEKQMTGVKNVRFTGYEYLYEVEPEKGETCGHEENHEQPCAAHAPCSPADNEPA